MISEDTLLTATKEYAQAFYASLPEATGCNHTFSPKFEKKMQHLRRKVKHQSTYSFLKRVACAIIAIILCGSALLMLNTEVRASVISWIKETYYSFICYSFAGGNNIPVAYSYDFKEVPEGYSFLNRAESGGSTTVLYISNDGNILSLSYDLHTVGGELFFKPEDHILLQENVDRITMDIYLSENAAYNNAVLWIENEILFTISANCDKDTLIALAQSVCPIE